MLKKFAAQMRRNHIAALTRSSQIFLCLAGAYIIFFSVYWHYQKSLLAIQPSMQFLNGASFTKVHFRTSGGLIFVVVYFDGQLRECTLDTGTAMTHVSYSCMPLSEAIPAYLFRSIGPPVPGIEPRLVATSVIHSIQIGDYMVRNLVVRSYAQSIKDPKNVFEPLLGNDLFRNVTIIIDWQTQTLVIAYPDSEKAPAHMAGWDKELSFTSRLPASRTAEVVLLPGYIGDSPTLLCFDTGQFIAPVCIVDLDVLRRLNAIREEKSEANVQLLDDVPWGVAGLHFHSMIMTDIKPRYPFQGLIGTPFLLAYRVGIDYASHRIFLHKYRRNEYLSRSSLRERQLNFGDL